jgi:hypothetical protein
MNIMPLIMLVLLLVLIIIVINGIFRKSPARLEQEEAARLKRIARLMAEPEDHDKETPRKTGRVR